MAGHQAAAVNTGPETQEIQPDGDPKTPRDEQSATDPGSNSAADRSSEPSLGPATDPNSSPNPNPEPAREPAPALAPLTPQEFRIYNRLAEQMEYFHDHFRKTYHLLHGACAAGRRPAGLTLKQFIDRGLELARYLDAHHTIEETHLYPLLARRMPEFRSSSSSSSSTTRPWKEGKQEDCELLRQHREIHRGMDEFERYLRRCKSRECELELGVLKEKMDSWGGVLLRHLDEEVRELGAERMRRYWTVEEMRAFPI